MDAFILDSLMPPANFQTSNLKPQTVFLTYSA